jgi:hypothetical protein
MVFIPDDNEEKYIEIFEDSTHGEFVLIRMTPTMLQKSIIDASEPLRILLRENLGIDYSVMGQGRENGITDQIQVLIDNELQTKTISYYRPETKKGDPRFWISLLHKVVDPFDLLLLTVWEGKLYAIPLKGELAEFKNQLNSIFKVELDSLPAIVLELQQKIKDIYRKGWIQTLRGGDTGVGYTFETLMEIPANSNKAPDYHGVEIKCSRQSATTLQTLFAKTPDYSALVNKRTTLVKDYGYWDEEQSRYALYMTINAVQENSKGWKLVFNADEERIYVTKEGKKVVFYDYATLRDSLAEKHKQTVFIKALSANRVKKNDADETFLYESALYCKDSSFVNFITLIEEGKISLDFAIHHDPETCKTRDHGFLWRIGKQYIPSLFKRQVKLCIQDADC